MILSHCSVTSHFLGGVPGLILIGGTEILDLLDIEMDSVYAQLFRSLGLFNSVVRFNSHLLQDVVSQGLCFPTSHFQSSVCSMHHGSNHRFFEFEYTNCLLVEHGPHNKPGLSGQ